MSPKAVYCHTRPASGNILFLGRLSYGDDGKAYGAIVDVDTSHNVVLNRRVDDSSYKVVLWFIVLSVAAAFSSGICEPFCPTLEATFADMLETSDSVVDVFAISSFLSIPKIRFLVWPNSFIFIGINFILPKLYINSALAMLNARKSHKSKSGESHVPRVLRFPPQNRSGDPGEPGVDIVLTESQTLSHPKYGRNCEV
ncbi:hypothetical protein EV421DRAFT_2000768 [Armillaria borealis]|uniref:DUF6534 domain-containing protein n=1 Tax=Armillaria borealis TaxID=47425 RepID=A0AA39IZ28_9AGAR|nr:hypothetical protein EV421DRAFT_2000768 [Armillaria borealis]